MRWQAQYKHSTTISRSLRFVLCSLIRLSLIWCDLLTPNAVVALSRHSSLRLTQGKSPCILYITISICTRANSLLTLQVLCLYIPKALLSSYLLMLVSLCYMMVAAGVWDMYVCIAMHFHWDVSVLIWTSIETSTLNLVLLTHFV